MKVVLAYSGGLDTSAILALLAGKGYEVYTVTVDVGQEGELQGVEEKAYKLGAKEHYTIDAVEEFAYRFIAPAIKANALYEGAYPLGTALARPLIAEKVSEVAKKVGADAVAHGCTSKGNDQVRFDLTLKKHLGDDLKIIAPVRELKLTREKSRSILEKAGVKVSKHGKYSIDENLWTRSIEGGVLDDPFEEPPEEVFEWTVPAERAPDKPLYLTVTFKEGLPVEVDGESIKLPDAVRLLNKLVGAHGYGRIDHIENRLVGLKSREVYEAPAALALIQAHMDLEKLVYTPRELRFKSLADREWTDMVYQGLWVEPLRGELQAFIESMNKWVTGTVRLKVYKGGLRIVGRESEYSSYSRSMIDYDKGWYPSDEEARGFINIWGMHSLTASWARAGNGLGH